MSRKKDVKKLKRALMRSNTRLLLSAVLLFQALAGLLLALKNPPFDMQALILAAALPLATWLVSRVIVRFWPVDRALVIMALLLCSIGILTLQDIARSPITPRTQAQYAALGVIAMFVGAFGIRKLKHWKKLTPYLMLLCLLALFSPWVFGGWKHGARNWVELLGGRFSLQPSEFMKPIFILTLASGFSNRPRFVKCVPTLAFAAACCAILLSQRDLGAVLLYFLTTVAMYFVATSNGFVTLAGLGMGAGAAVIAYQAFPYVRQRIAMWQNPWSDPEQYGYQIVQALIAIGSGGLFGMGLGLGSPRNIPLYHSDFIFAALTEEFGLIFSVCVLIIYVLIIMRGMITAMNARTSFHSLAAFGIVAMIGLQTMLIVGGNTKLLPLTGVTLPLISAGGSSLVSTFFTVGVLAGISSLNAQDEARDIERIEISEEAML
ncbi:MAG: FtsW/RodA/SpoVE family cell cycle protein [Christensenellales bacterium]|jgi:cell division protein FtsW (lipid II flippase)